ncbi:MAG: hypothetical protein U0175_23005 [Caldilineaceae bacterium]
MPTTSQMLTDYPDILLQVLAEMRGAFLDAADNRQQAVQLLAAQITDPASVQSAYQEAVDMAPNTQQAIEMLLKEQGEVAEAQFSREFGGIRQMGPAKLERETPWLYPESVAELLYYNGLIGRGFKGVGQNARLVIYLPSDITPWLPHPQNSALNNGLPVTIVPAPSASRTILTDDSFLEDTGTLLGFLLAEQLHLTPTGPHPEDIDRLVQRFQIPFDDKATDLNVRLALLLHIANRLGWLRRSEQGTILLTGNRVRAFLEKNRSEQRQMLWDAWRESAEWNDLCRTPGLECAETGNWQNDPLQTRTTLLKMIGRLQPGNWYSLDDIIEAIKKTDADFQRPTGRYDTWYIRSTTTQEFLKGFEQWDAVEGALLRFLFRGPLHWLGAIDLAEASAGDNYLVSLSSWGARWLGHDVPQPSENIRRTITVQDDFTIVLPVNSPLDDRFRIERFAQWQTSYPDYRFQISQRSLKRATESNVTAQQILEFLTSRCRNLPEKVANALTRYRSPSLPAKASA